MSAAIRFAAKIPMWVAGGLIGSGIIRAIREPGPDGWLVVGLGAIMCVCLIAGGAYVIFGDDA